MLGLIGLFGTAHGSRAANKPTNYRSGSDPARSVLITPPSPSPGGAWVWSQGRKLEIGHKQLLMAPAAPVGTAAAAAAAGPLVSQVGADRTVTWNPVW